MKWRKDNDFPDETGEQLCEVIQRPNDPGSMGATSIYPTYVRYIKGWDHWMNPPEGYKVNRWLDESDESPESSVWPGEEEIDDKCREIGENEGDDTAEKWACAVAAVKMAIWLQSRTAVPLSGNLKTVATPPYDGSYWDNTQPTAGVVKEEVKICKGCGVDWNISKKCWCLIPTFDQPSPSNPSITPIEIMCILFEGHQGPYSWDQCVEAMKLYKSYLSNPSIKRPTDVEVNEAADKKYPEWMLAAGPRKSGFIDGINWLLSIQPDK